jgi:hypothetical protein
MAKVTVGEWTIEDRGHSVSVSTDGFKGALIGWGPLYTSGTPEQRAAYNHLETRFASVPGVTALTVATELERYLKDTVVHGYTVDSKPRVTVPAGRIYEPTWYKGRDYDNSDPVIKYLRENTSASATQADVVAKITEYFEMPRQVKGVTVSKSSWPGLVSDEKGDLIGEEYKSGPHYSPVINAAKDHFHGKAATVAAVAEFIENWNDPWHDSTLRVFRDDKDNVVIGTPGKQFIRLSLVTGAAKAFATAEEAKR